jgi:hypothetical protein
MSENCGLYIEPPSREKIGWNNPNHDPRPAPFVFPRFKGRAFLGATPPPPKALPVRGKPPPAGPAAKGGNGAMRLMEGLEAPVWAAEMPRPGGLARYLRGRSPAGEANTVTKGDNGIKALIAGKCGAVWNKNEWGERNRPEWSPEGGMRTMERGGSSGRKCS